MTSNDEDAYGATISKRRLGIRLATMRQALGFKPNQVDDMLGWKRGRLGRIERSEWAAANPSFARDLARVYEASPGVLAEIMDMVARSDVRPWWRRYAQPTDPDREFWNEFPGFENDASRISVYTAQMIPELLQTPRYTDALTGTGVRTAHQRERARETRLRRQRILGRTDGTAPRLTAVITEASLSYRWGTDEERHAQVLHLAQASRRPNIELRLLRFEDGPPPETDRHMTILGFPDDQDPDIVFLGADSAIQECSRPEDTQYYIDAFARIRRLALAPSLTTGHLDTLAEAAASPSLAKRGPATGLPAGCSPG